MSETDGLRRRRRAAQGDTPDGGHAYPPAEQPQAAHDEQPMHTGQPQDGARRRRRSAAADGAQPPQDVTPHAQKPAEQSSPVVRTQSENRGAAARRKVRSTGKDKAKEYAGKALRTAKETALGIGAITQIAYQEYIRPAADALAGKIGEQAAQYRAKHGAAGKRSSTAGRRSSAAGRRTKTVRSAAGSAVGRGAGSSRTDVGGFSIESRHPHAQRSRQAAREEWIRRGLAAVLCCVACYSLFMIGSILWRTIRTNRLTDELSQLRRGAQQTAEPELTPEAVVQIAVEDDAQAGGQDGLQPAATPEPPQPSPTPQLTYTPVPRRQDTVKSTSFHVVGGDALPEMEELYNKNRDLIAWINIEEVLDLPIVYKNNSYYLTHDFYKNKSAAGTLFLDENHPFKEKTQNLLLHGHNMKDGTMFGRLAQYEHDINYLKNHAFISFDTLWRKEKYVIFAVLRVSLDVKSDQFFNYYSYPTFSSDAAFSSFVRQLQLRSMYAVPVDVEPSDALLMLSTCLDEDRLVIVARRIREDETRHDLRQMINIATKQ
ncbi:MAG: class B sortase [Clostridia bacterium]|nr:class B sortase [Clostridia bacterium]